MTMCTSMTVVGGCQTPTVLAIQKQGQKFGVPLNLTYGLLPALAADKTILRVCRPRQCRLTMQAVAGGAAGTGVKGTAVPLLNAEEVMARYRAAVHPAAASTFKAMYSSITGGITTDPACMLIPLDDHIVHRGHGVFDTAAIAAGHLYELDPHLDRILRSAAKAKISPPFPREQLREVIIETAAASGLETGHMRFWVSAGPGGFGLSPKECINSTFYVIALAEKGFPDPHKGLRVVTSQIPIKPPQFATTKSVNYLPNALLAVEAEEAGADVAIWLDQEGFIAEGPSMNVAFVTQKGVLVVPPFDKILEGCTAKRVIEIAPRLTSSASGKPCLVGVDQRPITVDEARQAAEMMLIGSGVLVTPVVQWDGRPVGLGKSGPVGLALRQRIEDDMWGKDATADRIKIPKR